MFTNSINKITGVVVFIILLTNTIKAVNYDNPYTTKALTPVNYKINSSLKPVVLCSQGKAEAVIVVPEKSDKNFYFRQIAELLKEHLDKATGCSFKIVNRLPKGAKGIFIGDCSAPEVASQYKTQMSMGDESFSIKSFKDGIMIVGKDKYNPPNIYSPGKLDMLQKYCGRGTFMGAVDFLERLIGFRFYMPGRLGTIIPDLKRKTFLIPAISYSDNPVYEMRLSSYGNYVPVAQDFKFLKTDKQAGIIWDFLLRHGDIKHHVFQHTDKYWYKAYGKTHPEYFALRKDGTRELGDKGRHSAHRCLTNEDGFKQHLKNLDDFYKGKLTKEQSIELFQFSPPTEKYISWGPADGYSGCQTAECKKLIDEDGDPAKKYSRLHWSYAKKLAEAIKKRWPDKILRVEAYAAWRKLPDNYKIPDNMLIIPCRPLGGPIGSLKEPKSWDVSVKEIDWLGKQKLKTWVYTYYPQAPRNSQYFPYLAPNVLKKLLTHTKGNLTGYLRCGHHTFSFALDSTIYYMFAKMLWNPDLDIDACLKEYCQLMFGPGAEDMYKYFTILVDRWENVRWKDFSPEQGARISRDRVWRQTYPREVRKELQNLLIAARAKTPQGTIYRERMDWMTGATEDFFSQGNFFDFAKKEQAECTKLSPAIDGSLDDCQGIKPLELKNNRDGKKLDEKTFLYVASDKANLYIAGKVFQKAPFYTSCQSTKHDSPVWKNDSIEVYICAERPGLAEALLNVTSQYHQFIIDHRGVIFDGYKSALDGKFDAQVNIPVNYKSEKTDFGYTFEMAVPFKSLGANVPKDGTVWNVNFYRNRHLEGQVFERQAWSPTMGKFNETSKFGLLRFSNSKMLWKLDLEKAKWQIGVRPPRDKWKKQTGKYISVKQSFANGKLQFKIKATPEVTETLQIQFNLSRVSCPNVSVNGTPSYKFAYSYQGDGVQRVRAGFSDTTHGKPYPNMHYLRWNNAKVKEDAVVAVSSKRSDKSGKNFESVNSFYFGIKIAKAADFSFTVDTVELYENSQKASAENSKK